ncbi:MAG: zinc-ribbon domain-containing protein [Promethearchaeota archaeon]
MARYCFNCGTEIEPEWNACANCGAKLKEDQDDYDLSPPQPYQPQPYQSQPYQQPQYPSQQQYYAKPSGENRNGIIAIIAGIIGCFCCGVILGPIAIIYGIKGKNEDAEPTLGTIGLILGVCNLIWGIISLIFIVSGIFFYYS